MKPEQNNIFKTNDFLFVSFWLLKGYKILNLERQNGGKVIFHLAPEAADLYHKWQIIPNKEMSLLQNYEAKRSKVLKTIKNFQNQIKSNQTYEKTAP